MAKINIAKNMKPFKHRRSVLDNIDFGELNNFERQKKIISKISEINPEYKDFEKYFNKLSIDDAAGNYSLGQLNKIIDSGKHGSFDFVADKNSAIGRFVEDKKSKVFLGKDDLEENLGIVDKMFEDFQKTNTKKANTKMHEDMKSRVKEPTLKKETQDILDLDEDFNSEIQAKKAARKLEEEAAMNPLLEKQKKYDDFYNNISELEDGKDIIGRDIVSNKEKFKEYKKSIIDDAEKANRQLNDFIKDVGEDNLSESQQAHLKELKNRAKNADAEFNKLESFNMKNIEVNDFIGEHSHALKSEVNNTSKKYIDFKNSLGDNISPEDAKTLEKLKGAFNSANDELQLFDSDKLEYAFKKKKDIDLSVAMEKDNQRNLNKIFKTDIKQEKKSYKKQEKELRKAEKKILGGTSEVPKGKIAKGMDLFAHGMAVWGAVSEYNSSRDEGKGVIPSVIKAAGSAAFSELLGGWIPLYYGAKALPKVAFQGIESISKNQRSLAYQSRRIPFSNANFNDNQKAYTMRQAGMELARNSQYNLQQSLLGNEAQYLK